MVRPEYEIIRIEGSVMTLSSCDSQTAPCSPDCINITTGCDFECEEEYCTGSDD